MATKNPRINITFEEVYTKLLTEIADQEGKSLSCLARELILEALDRREDLALSMLAKKRDIQKTKKIKHRDAWN